MVTPQQGLAVKKLAEVLKKKIENNMTKAFYRIDQGKNLPSGMDVSFALMNRSNSINTDRSYM